MAWGRWAIPSAAVATCSMMSGLATGKTVDEAYELDDFVFQMTMRKTRLTNDER